MNNVVNNIVAGSIGLLVLTGVLVGVTAFQTSQINNVANCGLNATGGAANPLYTGCNAAYNTTVGIGNLAQNFANQLPTTGTMFGIALILGAIGLIGYGIAQGAKRF